MAEEFWEAAFGRSALMWGTEPTVSAVQVAARFAERGVRSVLIPGVGYGRNARPFLERGMDVAGIEISARAIAFARSHMGLSFPIFHASVADMPLDDRVYGGIFCYGLIYLLDAPARQKFLQDCLRQLQPGGPMVFTVISRRAPMYGQGARLGEDRFERAPGLGMSFYGPDSVEREFGPHGLVDMWETEEPAHGGVALPFINVECRKA